MATMTDGSVGKAGGNAEPSLTLQGVTVAPLGRILPARPAPFLLLVGGLAIAVWSIGFALAPDRQRFLASAEWRFMPAYLAAHFIAVRLFISTFTRNFWAGVQHLDVAPDKAMHGVRWLLGPLGLAAAIAIAAPFAWFDFHYLTGANSRYERMGPDNTLATIDLMMWGTWVVEWTLNALIWVMLLGFLAKNCAIIANRPFRAPIELVVAERHFKPFLQMSAEGASIILGFSALTIFYLWYTGGELTDYVGLAITAALLIVGFVPPWLLLRSKVTQAVEAESRALRVGIATAMWRDAKARGAGQEGPPAEATRPSLEQRLEEALALYRISYLEHLKLNLGGSEARAILVRLVAPAIGVAWQVGQNPQSMLPKLEAALQAATTWVGRLGLW